MSNNFLLKLRKWENRWLFSTNLKGISTLYFLFNITLFLTIRAELAFTDTQFLAVNNQLYNIIVNGQSLIMIFFTVMPILIGGFGNFFVSILIRAPDMASLRFNILIFLFLSYVLVLTFLSGFIGEKALIKQLKKCPDFLLGFYSIKKNNAVY